MVPISVTMIPTFLLFRDLRLIDTLYPLIARGVFGQAFVIFLMRQFYMTLPKELDDAAFVDGYSRLQIWWKIIMPLSKPILATVIIFVFQQVYNDFQNPLIYLNSTAKFTVQLGLASFKGLYATRYDLLMAASVFTLVPILVLYLSAQKYFVEGIVMTGLKG
jgi:multiple sugar transport system permease protein